MEHVVKSWILSVDGSFVVICDGLFAYNLFSKFPERGWDDAVVRAKQRGENLHKMVAGVLRREGCIRKAILVDWADVADRVDFRRFRDKITDLVRENPLARRICDNFVSKHARAAGSVRQDFFEENEWNYLLNEISISIFVTEKLGYFMEVWEPISDTNAFDPIATLYSEIEGEILEILGVSKLRRLRIQVGYSEGRFVSGIVN